MVERRSAAWQAILRAVDLSKAHAAKTHAYLAVNTKTGSKPRYEYPGFSILTEFFSDEEFSDLLSAFRAAVQYAEGIVGEEAFISKGSALATQSADTRSIVYCTVGSSPGRASSVLLPAFCELHGIPTCSADSYAFALTDNKFHAYQLLRSVGIPTPQTWLCDEQKRWLLDAKPPTDLRVIVKPVNGCASIGVTPECVGPFGPALEDFVRARVASFGEAFIVQEFIEGYEAEVPVFDVGEPVALMACGLSIGNDRRLDDRIFDYDTVFDDRYGFYDFSAENPAVAETCLAQAEAAYRILALSGIARIDFRISRAGDAFATDINAAPHLTPHGSPAFAIESMGASHVDLIHALISIGHRRIDAAATRLPKAQSL